VHLVGFIVRTWSLSQNLRWYFDIWLGVTRNTLKHFSPNTRYMERDLNSIHSTKFFPNAKDEVSLSYKKTREFIALYIVTFTFLYRNTEVLLESYQALRWFILFLFYLWMTFLFLNVILTLRWLMSYIYIWSTHSWCF